MEIIAPAPVPASLAFRPRAFGGWPLEAICDLDADCPGFLNHVLHASDAKRQTLYCAAALLSTGTTEALGNALGLVGPSGRDALGAIARGLVVRKPSAIVQAVFGSVPDSFLGALARLGPDPLSEPRLYRDLHTLFADPEQRNRARLLRQTPGAISETKVRIALALDPVLVCQQVFDSLQKPEEVEQLHAALNLIRRTVSTATDEALSTSLKQLEPGGDPSDWAKAWL